MTQTLMLLLYDTILLPYVVECCIHDMGHDTMMMLLLQDMSRTGGLLLLHDMGWLRYDTI